MAKRNRRRGRRGVGQTITIRRMRGLGALNKPSSFMGSALPPLLGGGLAAITVLATRYFAKPTEGETPKMLYKWAPLLGLASSGVGSLALYYLGGMPAALSSFTSGAVVSGAQIAHDYLTKDNIGEHVTAFPPETAVVGGNGVTGFGVIVPQRLSGANGTRGILMEPAAARDPLRRYGLGSMGEDVSLGAVNPAAFGTPGFGY